MVQFRSFQFSSVAQSCPTLCNPMDCSKPGLPVHHQLLEFTQTHVHWVGDAIQPSHPLLSPSPPAFHLSQHQGLFQWVSSSHQVAKRIGVSSSASVLPVNIQDWFPFGWTSWISLQSKGLSRVFSNTTVQKYLFLEELMSLWMKVKEESEKAGLKLNIQKIKIMASGPITSWQIDGETVADFMKLKDTYSLEGKWPT